MAVWTPSTSALFVPPVNVPALYSTKEFVQRTSYVFHGTTERLLTIGNPYFPLIDRDVVIVPKVSAYQYRVFRIKLPDPNKFPIPESARGDKDSTRLVWAVQGIQVNKSQPLGVGPSGNTMSSGTLDYADSHHPGNEKPPPPDDRRINSASDSKQSQVLIVGCIPPMGQHWDASIRCTEDNDKEMCPPLELKHTVIEDGDMVDMGLGTLNFSTLCSNKSTLPLELINSISKYPDWLTMNADPFGNHCFFMLRREQVYLKSVGMQYGNVGEDEPTDYHIKGGTGTLWQTPGRHSWFPLVSGSLATSDNQLYNRPYWIENSTAPNDGICWHNQLFVTCADTTRNTIFNISTLKKNVPATSDYKESNFTNYSRHVEEYEISFILRLCMVNMDLPVLNHLHNMDPMLLEDWGFGTTPPPNLTVEDQYRFLQSKATKCPPTPATPPDADKWAKYKFWDVDCTEQISSDLSPFPLGRRFLQLYPKAATATRTLSSSSRKRRRGR
ncbi:L1 capsid protein [Chelonia mydas papillomavirus 1]|uniref:Major capsid protein L1 n=2 Tax=Chelonia mydas papillomavirus 1 TaxID=485242 RepID=B6RUP7_9PAPI|nr:L1 capsid protein [Chelonia mydas papillomavirus 1]QJX58439.1 L1 capsid protein [Chelonia mydas papillomavirus 1]